MGLGLLGLAAAEMLYDGWQLPLLLFWVWVIGYMDADLHSNDKELRHQMARLDQTCDPAPLLAWCHSVLRQNPGSTPLSGPMRDFACFCWGGRWRPCRPWNRWRGGGSSGGSRTASCSMCLPQ